MDKVSEKVIRYKNLFSFILKYGNSDLFKQPQTTEVEDELKPKQESHYSPEDLVKDLQELGPTFIKLGQLLSTRPDLLPRGYLHALSALQDKVPPISFDEVRNIFEQEIGIKLSKAFREFDEKPLASASIGQVHKARLISGKQVVVKVQRPGIRGKMLKDLNALKEITDFGVKYSATAKKYAFDDLLEELRYIIIQELDYYREASNLITLGKNLKKFEKLTVPQPVPDYSSSRVLTMDYMPGIKVTDMSPLLKTEQDLRPLVNDLLQAYLRQIIVDGFVHADPHPGNLKLTPDFKLAFIDLGMVARFTDQMQEHLLKLLLGISKADGNMIIDLLLSISKVEKEADIESFRKIINRQILENQDKMLTDMQVGRQLIILNRVAAEKGIHLPPEFNVLGKVLLNLDQIVALMAPGFDLQENIRRHVLKMIKMKFLAELKAENYLPVLLELRKFIESFPLKLNRLSENLANNDFKIKMEVIDEKHFTDGFQKVANRITLGLIIASMIIGAAMLMQIPTRFTIFGYPGLAIILFLLAAIAGFILGYLIVFRDDNSKK